MINCLVLIYVVSTQSIVETVGVYSSCDKASQYFESMQLKEEEDFSKQYLIALNPVGGGYAEAHLFH